MAFSLPQVLQALLFSSSQPLSVKDIQAAFTRFHEQAPKASTEAGDTAENDETQTPAPAAEEAAEVVVDDSGVEDMSDVPSLITAAQIREAMDALASELREKNDVYLLTEGPQGYRLVTHPRFARWVRVLRNEPAPAKLSQSALETLAIVAYRQPVTRSEIEAIRGVSADAGLNKLLERELVYITGRADLPGRPLQYGTTDQFMEFVGVKSLVELPSSDVLSPRQIDEWLKNAMNPSTPGDAEMGLPLEEGEGDTPLEDDAHVEVDETPADADADKAEAETASDDEVDHEKPV